MIKRHIGGVFLIIGFFFVFGFLKQVFLARELTKSDMGFFSLLMTIIAFAYPVTLLGQQNSVVRFFSKNVLSNFNWKRLLYKIIIVSGLLAVVLLMIFAVIYNIKIGPLIFLFIALIGSVIGDLFPSIIRSQGHYEKLIFLQRSIRFVFPVILLVLYILDDFQLSSILIWFSFSYIVYVLVIILVTNRGYQNGPESVPSRVHIDGLFFLGSDISLLIVVSVDKLLIAKLMNLEDLAVYFATFTLMRIYELALQSIEYVMMPYSNKIEKIRIGKFFKLIFLISGGITVFYILYGPILMRIVYQNKYNEGISLIPLFCMVGVVRVFYSLPYSIIGGRLKQIALKYLLYSNLSLVILNVVLGVVFISLWGLPGAILATLLVWVFRTCGAYIIFYKFR